MNETTKKYGTIIGVGVICLLAGRFLLQPAPKTQEVKVEYKEKIVYLEKKEEQKKVKTVIKEKKNADGSSETETVITDDSTIKTDVKTESDKQLIETKKTSTKGVVVGVLALAPIKDFKKEELNYALTGNAPIAGRLGIQGILTVDKNFTLDKAGLGLTIEF